MNIYKCVLCNNNHVVVNQKMNKNVKQIYKIWLPFLTIDGSTCFAKHIAIAKNFKLNKLNQHSE